MTRAAVVLLAAVLLASCAARSPAPATESMPGPTGPTGPFPSASWPGQDGPPSEYSVDPRAVPDAVPRAEPRAVRGNPPFYEVAGQRHFVMDSAAGYVERGIASWYGTKFHGRETSSGEPYDMFAMTAAHKNLPLPTYAKVTNLENGRSVVVRINDRGPFVANRLIDLSYAAAVRLDIVGVGTGLVEVRTLLPGDPEAPETAVAAAPRIEPRIFMQAGAFSSRENAERVATRLRVMGLYNVDLYTREGEQPRLYRVRVGPLVNVAEVDRVTERLTRAGFPEARVVIE